MLQLGSVWSLLLRMRDQPSMQETMYGQTNCWALPEGKYGAYRGLDGEVYIMTARAALNLSYQVGTRSHALPACDGAGFVLHAPAGRQW